MSRPSAAQGNRKSSQFCVFVVVVIITALLLIFGLLQKFNLLYGLLGIIGIVAVFFVFDNLCSKDTSSSVENSAVVATTPTQQDVHSSNNTSDFSIYRPPSLRNPYTGSWSAPSADNNANFRVPEPSSEYTYRPEPPVNPYYNPTAMQELNAASLSMTQPNAPVGFAIQIHDPPPAYTPEDLQGITAGASKEAPQVTQPESPGLPSYEEAIGSSHDVSIDTNL